MDNQPQNVAPPRPTRRRLIALAAALSVGAAACGASDPIATPAVPTTAAPTTVDGAADGGAPTADNLFPNVSVQNVADGTSLNLQEELAGGDLPVLLWFWAPH